MQFRDFSCAALALSVVLTQHTLAQSSTFSDVQLPVQTFAKANGNDTTRELELSPPTATDPGAPTVSWSRFEEARRARVLYDERDDGTQWAVGGDYKVGFEHGRAEYRPGFGARDISDTSWDLTPQVVRLAGQTLEFERSSPVARTGDIVQFERGAFVEHYSLTPGAVEQSFVFDALPTRGALEIEIAAPSILVPSETAEGLVFHGEFGHVTYSRAVAIDARGRRVEAPTSCVDGVIRIRVDAQFVREAALPLIVDPTIVTVLSDASSTNITSSDCVYDSAANVWFIVYQRPFSGLDFDLLGFTFEMDYDVFGVAQIEASTASWERPRCAVLPGSNRICVVAEVTSVVPKIAVARLVLSNSGVIQTGATIFNVAGTITGDVTAPDVGGDPYAGTPAFFCIVFEHKLSATEKEIGYRRLAPEGTLMGLGPTYLAHAPGETDARPSISSSNEEMSWTVAWERSDILAPADLGIYAARIFWSGGLVNAPFLLQDGPTSEDSPSVSSPMNNSSRVIVAFRQVSAGSSQGDIVLIALEGATVLSTVNLTTLENAGTAAQEQREPSIDCDGAYFFVAYGETSTGTNDFNLYGCEVRLAGSLITVARPHVLLRDPTPPVSAPRVAGRFASAATNHWFIGYQIQRLANDSDLEAIDYSAIYPGGDENVCFGNGISTACPCGNSGALTNGCAHSLSSSGGRLRREGGILTVSFDTFALQTSNVPPGTPCLIFQGTALNAGTSFGDGLLCLGGTLTRLAVVFAGPNGVVNSPFGLSALGHVPATGGVRYYQSWYRDSSPSFCSASTFNLTNGVAIHWLP